MTELMTANASTCLPPRHSSFHSISTKLTCPISSFLISIRHMRNKSEGKKKKKVNVVVRRRASRPSYPCPCCVTPTWSPQTELSTRPAWPAGWVYPYISLKRFLPRLHVLLLVPTPQAAGWENMAFIFLNHFLDVCDVRAPLLNVAKHLLVAKINK